MILEPLKNNCEIILPPIEAINFRAQEYTVESLTDSDKEYVYKMIRRHLNKDLATNYRNGRKTAHSGEFESIALAKRLGTSVVMHDKRARQWAKCEGVSSMHPIDVPEMFQNKLNHQTKIEFLSFHCKMRYEPACEKLKELEKSRE